MRSPEIYSSPVLKCQRVIPFLVISEPSCKRTRANRECVNDTARVEAKIQGVKTASGMVDKFLV